MTTNMSNSNHLNGQSEQNGHNGHQPSAGVSVVEPSVIQALANQFYSALPGATIPSAPSTEGLNPVPSHSTDGVVALGNSSQVPAPHLPSGGADPLTAIAQQLYRKAAVKPLASDMGI